MPGHLHDFDDYKEGEREGDHDEEEGEDGEELGADAGALVTSCSRILC